MGLSTQVLGHLTSRRRVLVLNNYSFQRVEQEVEEHVKPAHHLYAVEKLRNADWDVTLIPFDETRPAPRPGILRRLLPPLGDLSQQWQAWRQRHDADVIYAPCQTQTQLLSYLRALGLFGTPLVVVAHHPPVYGRASWWRRWWVRLELSGTDVNAALSKAVAEDLNLLGRKPQRSQVLHWGADLSFYPRPDGSPGTGTISAGRTGRDFATLAKAAELSGIAASIFCLKSDPVMHSTSTFKHVKVHSVNSEADLTYRTLVPHLAAARVHSIPLHGGRPLAGLTSLVDALALGKPVIMTRHPLIDVDLEGERIGRWVDPGDTAAWVDALRWFDTHPAESAAMGARARKLAETLWNDQVFAQEVEALLKTAAGEAPLRSTGS